MAPWPSSADGSLSGSPEPVAYSCPCRAIQTRRWEGIVRGQQLNVLLLDRTHLEAMLSGLRSPADLPGRRFFLAGDGHVGVVDLDKPPRFRSTTAFAHRTQTGTASRSCSRSTPTASTARRPQLTSASPRPSAPRTPRKTSVTRATATSSRHPEMAGQSGNPGGSGLHNRSCRPRPWPFPRPSVGWSAPVRGRFTHGPSTARTPKPGAHGHIADGGGPKSRLGRRPRWSPGGDSGGASGL